MARMNNVFPWFRLTPYSAVTTFLGLTDTPNSYAGQSLKSLRVNAGETALEFTSAGAGDVSSTDTVTVNNEIAVFSGTGGKTITSATGSGIVRADSGIYGVTDSVTLNEIQNITAARLLGRYDATATGRTQQVALGAALAFDSTAGTLLVSDCGIVATKLGDTAVTTAKINDAAVTNAKLGDTSVTTTKINDAAVTNAKLGDTSVTTTKINDAAVTYAKIQSVTARRLLGREDVAAGSPQEVALSAELRFDTDNDWLEVSDSGILTGLIADSAVTTGKLNNAGVTYAKIQNVAASRLLGRYDATAAGVTQEISLDTDLSFDSTNGRIRTFLTRPFSVQVLDGATALTTGDGKAYWRIPASLNGIDVTGVAAQVIATSTTGTPTIQIARGRQATPTSNFTYTDILSTKITIDSGEYDAKDAATAAVIDTSNDTLNTGDVLRIDVDSAGTGTTGLNVTVECKFP